MHAAINLPLSLVPHATLTDDELVRIAVRHRRPLTLHIEVPTAVARARTVDLLIRIVERRNQTTIIERQGQMEPTDYARIIAAAQDGAILHFGAFVATAAQSSSQIFINEQVYTALVAAQQRNAYVSFIIDMRTPRATLRTSNGCEIYARGELENLVEFMHAFSDTHPDAARIVRWITIESSGPHNEIHAAVVRHIAEITGMTVEPTFLD